jgi:hypothetical protein
MMVLGWLVLAGGPRACGADLPDLKADLQAQIDAAKDGAVVRIPRGRYVLDKGLVVKGRKKLTLKGDGRAQVLVKDVNSFVLQVRDSESIRVENLHLRHLKPLKEYACHGDVIEVRNARKVVIDNCDLDGCGAVGVAAWNSSELTVRHCHIRRNSFNAFCLSECKDVLFHACVIEDNANLCQSYNVDGLELSDNLIRRNGGYWRKKDPAPGLRKETPAHRKD